VEQNVVRLAVDEQGMDVLVHVLPGGRFDKVASLSDEELIDLISHKVEHDELKQLAEVLLFYECRCHDKLILDMVGRVPEDRRKELWGNLDKLEIKCPRCDREYVINRKEHHNK
jgi:redox-regulated HSP33 family molecular chaperone